jgi:methylated-DNA-[protein]-cysteine S-methyltransferase
MPRITRSTTVDSPLGRLTLTACGGFLTGLTMDGQKHVTPAATPADGRPDAPGGSDADACLEEAQRQLDAYFAGGLTRFDIPLRLAGTDFQMRVWRSLQDIPYGHTISYGDLARRVGNPQASRAVGLANGRNPVAVVVPCHRVIGADGRLTGYAGGLERKIWLLDHERADHGALSPASDGSTPRAGAGAPLPA